jgi:hypothetical protein
MNTWSEIAFNTAPDSENRIHGDELAKEYGFEGGLVPGVTISAYKVHPVIEVCVMSINLIAIYKLRGY